MREATVIAGSGTASTSNPASFQAKIPPLSGRTLRQPMLISCLAMRAAEASLGQATRR